MSPVYSCHIFGGLYRRAFDSLPRIVGWLAFLVRVGGGLGGRAGGGRRGGGFLPMLCASKHRCKMQFCGNMQLCGEGKLSYCLLYWCSSNLAAVPWQASRPDPGPPAQSAGKTSTTTTAGSSAKRDGPPPGSGKRRGSSSAQGGASGAAAAALPATGGGGAGAGLLLAMAIGGPGDGLLTRDAVTIEEYILLMSNEAVAEKSGMGERDLLGAARWRQVRCCPAAVAWGWGMGSGRCPRAVHAFGPYRPRMCRRPWMGGAGRMAGGAVGCPRDDGGCGVPGGHNTVISHSRLTLKLEQDLRFCREVCLFPRCSSPPFRIRTSLPSSVFCALSSFSSPVSTPRARTFCVFPTRSTLAWTFADRSFGSGRDDRRAATSPADPALSRCAYSAS